jgi:hypothetical protein
MSQAATVHHSNSYMTPSMRWPLVISGLLHLIVALIAAFGLPHFVPEKPMIITPISIEIVPVDKITQTNKVAAPKKEKPPEDIKEPPVPEKPAPPKMEAAPAEPEPETIPAPAEDIKPPEEKPVKPAPKKPPVKTPEDKKVKPKENDFDALLKNLTPDADKAKEPVRDINDILAAVGDDAQPLPIGDRITMSETDALVNGLRPCWNVLSGAKYAENLVVEVRVIVNPDRTVQQATIINQGLYNTDSHFKAAANAALRALRNPECSPLQLPPDKYDQWKNIVINFDPREML